MRDHLAMVEDTNAAILERVGNAVVDVIASDGLVFTAGTGHSAVPVLESFYRAGGLACVYPIYHPALNPLEGAAASTHLERSSGLAQLLVEAAGASNDDIAFVFSNSGVNAVPVELALQFKQRGVRVAGVSSRAHMEAAPRRHEHRLDEFADHLLDTLVPFGDSTHPPDHPVTGAMSSLVCLYVWNLLLARVIDLAGARGIDVPLWESANTARGEERNQTLRDRYRTRIPGL
ncbi:MAG: sugar isomerase domain-containing protein [Actinobacteria bacterium]|nr:sugar isomerase domain-containing protein [Actinomycetota bacterium]